MAHPLATVRKLTGRTIRLGVFEEVAAASISETRIVVAIHRAKVIERKHGYEIKKKGNTIYEFVKSGDKWIMSEPLTVWYDLAEPEVYATYAGKTPAEYAAWSEWVDMCHRPGTPTHPLDNAARRAQGIK